MKGKNIVIVYTFLLLFSENARKYWWKIGRFFSLIFRLFGYFSKKIFSR